MNEGSNINKSLLTLQLCITKLGEKQQAQAAHDEVLEAARARGKKTPRRKNPAEEVRDTPTAL